MSERYNNIPAFIVILLSVFTGAIDSTIVANSIPLIAKSFNNYTEVNLITLAFFITSSAVVPIYGKLGDIIGRKRVLVTAQCIFFAGLLLGSISQSMTMLIVARAIQGLGGGGIITAAFTSVNDVVCKDSVLKYRGYVGIPFTIAGVLGPVLGGFISYYYGWRCIFYILSAITIVTIILTYTIIPHNKVERSDNDIDVVGYALISVFLLSLFMIFFNPAWVTSLVSLTVSVLSGYAYMHHSHKGKPLSLHPLKYIHFRVSSVSSFFVGASLTSFTVFMPLWLQWYAKMSPTTSGMYMTVFLIALEAVYIASGFTLGWKKYHVWHMYIGSASLSAGLMIVYLIHVGYFGLINGFILSSVLIGAGVGALIQYNVMIAQSSNQPNEVGSSIASMDTFRNVGAYLGLSIINIVYVELTKTIGHESSIEIVMSYGFMIMSILNTLPILMHLYHMHVNIEED